MKKLFEEFKKFAFKGNVLDMAVGVMIASAFGKIVTSLVNDLFRPVLSLLTGGQTISALFLPLADTQGVTYAKGHTIIGDPKTPAGKRKMLILPGLLETLELSQSELNDPEAYVLPSLDDPHTPLSFQADRRLWDRVKKSINVYGKTPPLFPAYIRNQSTHSGR